MHSTGNGVSWPDVAGGRAGRPTRHHRPSDRTSLVASPPVRVSAEAARRFLVAHHMLGPARALDGGPDAVMEVVHRLGSVQFDPLSVAGRNHDLVLHARVAGYDPGWCDLLWERRELFEAYNKGLSLVPTSKFPWFRANLDRSSPRILAEHADVAEQVLVR